MPHDASSTVVAPREAQALTKVCSTWFRLARRRGLDERSDIAYSIRPLYILRHCIPDAVDHKSTERGGRLTCTTQA